MTLHHVIMGRKLILLLIIMYATTAKAQVRVGVASGSAFSLKTAPASRPG